MTKDRISNALDEAKGYFALFGGLEEEKANRDQILLRELEHAMSILSGQAEELNQRRILHALIEDDLFAETRGGTIVPRPSWPQEFDDGLSWFVGVPTNDAIVGFQGELIFVPRGCAIDWLHDNGFGALSVTELPIGARIKHATTRDLEDAYLKFISECESKAIVPTPDVQTTWRKTNDISRQRYRELKGKLAPDSWSRRGPRGK